MTAFIYLLRKLSIQLVLPINLFFIFLIYAVIKNKKNLIFLLIGFFYLSSINVFSEALIRFIEYPYKFKDVDMISQHNAVVVLSGGILNSKPIHENIHEWNDPDRFFGGINLYKSNKSKILVFTGGFDPFNKYYKSEGELLKNESNKLLVGNENIIVTPNVVNTFQEANQIKKLVLDSKITNDVILVTSAYHMRRASLIFKKSGIKIYPYPVDFKSTNQSFSEIILNPINWIPNTESLNTTNFALREIYGFLIYKII